jgi:hypothetical protein
MKQLFESLMVVILALVSSSAMGNERVLSTEANVMVELTLKSAVNHPDPFNDITLDAIVTDPNGRELRVPGFWDGARVWKLRYASLIPGVHKFQTICSDPGDSGLHAITGRIVVSPYKGANPLHVHGPLQVASSHRYLEYADGTPFFWLGDTWWMGLCGRLHWPNEFNALASDRAAKGFNVIQIIAGLYPEMSAFDPRGANEAGFPWTQEFERIRPEYFDAADKRIKCLVDHGLTPCIVGAWGFYLPWMGLEKIRQHWRYLIARYGALPVVWCAAGEASLPWYSASHFPDNQPDQICDWTEVMKYIRATDPFHRLLTVHPSGKGRASSRAAVQDPAVLDFDMLQTPHGSPILMPETVSTLRQSWADHPVMPVIDGEACYELLQTPEETVSTALSRRMFWTCMLNGAAGHTYGANGIWQCNRREQPFGLSPKGANYGSIAWDAAMLLPGAQQVCLGKKLLEQFPWQHFEPHPEWVEFSLKPDEPVKEDPFAPMAAGIPGALRIIYVPQPDSIRAKNLDAGASYTVTCVDPLNGHQSALPELRAPDDRTWIFRAPPGNDHDWLVILRNLPVPSPSQ